MTGFLDLPLELRNAVYEYLIDEPLEQRSRGVMVITEKSVVHQLPSRAYGGLVAVNRQIYHEFKEAVRFLANTRKVHYELDATFTHGRPFFSVAWKELTALSHIVNSLILNVGLRIWEPYIPVVNSRLLPNYFDLRMMLDDGPNGFAYQLFDYVAILLKSLASLQSLGNGKNPYGYKCLYVEELTFNLRTPVGPQNLDVIRQSEIRGDGERWGIERVNMVECGEQETVRYWRWMKDTLDINAHDFKPFPAALTHRLSPLIQIGSLKIATEGQVVSEGHNLVLADENFKWLRF